jgi:signal transduction histidine kinase
VTSPPLRDRWGRHRLPRRVALLVGFGSAVPMLLLAWLASGVAERLTASLLHERQALARTLAARFDQELQRIQGSLVDLAAAPAFDLSDTDLGPERAALHRAWLQARRAEQVALFDATGQALAQEPSDDSSPAPLALDPGLAAGRPRVYDLERLSDGRPRVRVVVPLRDWRGQVAGYATARLDLTHESWASLLEPAGGAERAVELLDGSGAVLVSSRRVPHPEASPASGDGLAVLAPLAAAPWKIAVHEPHDAALPPMLALRRRMLWLVPTLVALALLFGWGVARSVTQPVALLAASADQIAGGTLAQPIPYVGEDEVGRLGKALERMRLALERSLEEVTTVNRELEARVQERTRELSALYAQLQQRDLLRQRLLQKLISAQEDERRRIARELHDETCQMLAALSMGVDTALRAPGGEALAPRLAEVKTLATRALSGVHGLIFDLRPSVLDDLGLLAAIRWFASRNLEARGISVRCEFEPLASRMPPEMETALFRVVQEALNNVVRHSNADSVLIQVEERNGQLEIEIEDDGRGFDPESVAQPGPGGRGLGLMGIRERIELLGGTVDVDSAPDDGTRIAVRVPLPVTEAA